VKLSSLILLILSTHSSFAQFGFVRDKDGYVNIRDSATNRSKIIDTLHNGHLVWSWRADDKHWTHVQFSRKEEDYFSGFVYNDRIKPVDDYDSIPLVNDGENTAICKRDSISVIVTQQKFNRAKYRITYDKDHQIVKMNGKEFWGTDGWQPNFEYKSITITIGQRIVTLPRAALANLFEPTVSWTKVYYDRQNDILYISTENGDTSGAYAVIWRIVKGVYSDRYVMGGF
jgi:hypothetical protein